MIDRLVSPFQLAMKTCLAQSRVESLHVPCLLPLCTDPISLPSPSRAPYPYCILAPIIQLFMLGDAATTDVRKSQHMERRIKQYRDAAARRAA